MDLESITASLFAAAENGDWDTFASYFADHAILRRNIGRPETLAEAMVSLPRITAAGTTLRYENVRRQIGASSVTEMHDAVFTRADGTVVRLDICVVIEFDPDGLIVATHEYLDSAAAAALVA